MLRSHQIVLVAHCMLNQNSVIKGWARARGAFPQVVQMILEKGIGMIQLPCPEKTFSGLQRPPMTVEEYNTETYRQHCTVLLKGLIDDVVNYREHGVELVGMIGIEDSPSCCPQKGIFYQILLEALATHGLSTRAIQVPPDFREDLPREDFLTELENWLIS